MGPHKRSTSALMGGVVVGTCTLCTLTSAFNKSYVSPLISLVGALMVNTILNLLGFLDASGRSRSSSRPLACPT